MLILNALQREFWDKVTLVDGDPTKHGLCVPGSKKRVLSPAQIDAAMFDFVFVASITSAPEIVALLRERGYQGPITHLAAHGDSLFVTDLLV